MDHSFEVEQIATDVRRGPDIVDVASFIVDGCVSALNPEGRLMRAILGDAVMRLCRGIRRPGAIRKNEMYELRDWLRAEDRADKVRFGFGTICDVLGIEPRRVREYVAAYEKTHRQAVRDVASAKWQAAGDLVYDYYVSQGEPVDMTALVA